MPYVFRCVGRKRKVTSCHGANAVLVVRVVEGIDGRSRRVVKRPSALVGERGCGGSRSSRSGGRREVVAHWVRVMALVGVDAQEAEVAAVLCLEVHVVQIVCGRVVDAAGEESVGEHEVGHGHIDESKSGLPGKEASSATNSEGSMYRSCYDPAIPVSIVIWLM